MYMSGRCVSDGTWRGGTCRSTSRFAGNGAVAPSVTRPADLIMQRSVTRGQLCEPRRTSHTHPCAMPIAQRFFFVLHDVCTEKYLSRVRGDLGWPPAIYHRPPPAVTHAHLAEYAVRRRPLACTWKHGFSGTLGSGGEELWKEPASRPDSGIKNAMDEYVVIAYRPRHGIF